MIWLFSLIPIHHAKNRKAYQGSLQVSSTSRYGVRALALPLTWVLLGTCRQREESPAIALPYCFSVFLYCIVFCLSSADCRRREDWKVEFPDDSSFPCPSPYRGCGGWPFGNRIHRLMRSFHPSIINIAEVSILWPPWMEKFFNSILLHDSLQPLRHFERCRMWLWMIMLFVLLRLWTRKSPTVMRLVPWWNGISPLRSATVDLTARKKQPLMELLFSL